MDPNVDVTITIRVLDFRNPASADVAVSNAVYQLGCAIYEHAGEHNRHEDGTPVWRGNGHHAAQALAEAAVAQWHKGASK